MEESSTVPSTKLQYPLLPRTLNATPLQISAIAIFLLCLGFVYWWSLPLEFNLKYDSRNFFDSDGEFITRQFIAGKTYTHNNHILYHYLGAKICELVGCGKNAHFIALVHKSFSVLLGTIGIATVFLASWWWLGRVLPALATALFLGGTSSYWFFSASIDTYIPHLAAALISVWLSLWALRSNARIAYLALGVAIGISFLFRTDGALCGVLAVVAFACKEQRWSRLVLCAGAAAVVGIPAYIMIAVSHYHVAPNDLVFWALGHLDRPEVNSGVWGSVANVTPSSLWLVFVNNLFYAVFIPGVEATRSASFILHYRGLAGGLLGPGLWICVVAWVLISQFGNRRPDRDGVWLIALAGIWFVPRVIFYTWWDPFDPFLFSVLSLPAAWLLLLALLNSSRCSSGKSDTGTAASTAVGLVSVLALLVWVHNAVYLISPLRTFALQ